MSVLTRKQKNELWHTLAESGLRINDFVCSPMAWDDGDVILHIPSGSQVQIYGHNGKLRFKQWVGEDPSTEIDAPDLFEDLQFLVRSWSREISEWIDTPDLWNSVPGESSIPGGLAPDSANTPFTPDEQAAIADQLKSIAEKVKQTYELTAEQSAEIDKKFEEAEKASRRMGRKDWGMFLGGALLSLILSDAITPGIMGHILMMMEHGIGHLFTGGPSVRGILSAGLD